MLLAKLLDNNKTSYTKLVEVVADNLVRELGKWPYSLSRKDLTATYISQWLFERSSQQAVNIGLDAIVYAELHGWVVDDCDPVIRSLTLTEKGWEREKRLRLGNFRYGLLSNWKWAATTVIAVVAVVVTIAFNII